MIEYPDANQIPLATGTYCLWLPLDAPLSLNAGRLGARTLPPGLFAYVGSALGPGGLRARVGRHLRAEKRLRWHIDWLTARAPVRMVWARTGRERFECTWSAALRTLPGAAIAWPGFGASDCACPSHLIIVPHESLSEARLALAPDVVIGTLDGYER